ncbi:MAG: DUF4175 domain-containing protein [Alphaproteobacteria bacterium]
MRPRHATCDDPRPWLRRKLRWTWLVLTWERLWRALWPLVCLLGLFVSLALLDGLPRLPGGLHAAILGLLGLALLAAGLRAHGMVVFPDRQDLIRRLESSTVHRPLTALEDFLATDDQDPATRAFWHAHLVRMEAQARRLPIGLPRPGLAAVDPLGLRAAVLLLLVIAVTQSQGQRLERLGRALRPSFSTTNFVPATVRLWITPPPYTRLPPRSLEDGPTGDQPAETPREVPEGSTVLALVTGAAGTPEMRLGERLVPFDTLGDASHRLETIIDRVEQLAVVQEGRTLARWNLRVVIDTPPEVAFLEAPKETSRWRLGLSYQVRDDYGVAGVSALIQRQGHPRETPLEVTLPLSTTRPRNLRETGYPDLTAHPWTGLPVSLRLSVRDDKGQIGLSDPVAARLPERVFSHPVARKIAENRQRLITSPETFTETLSPLDELSRHPEDFAGDPVVFLALRIAHDRLSNGASDDALVTVRDLLWQTALRVEDGAGAAAERALEEIEKELAETMADGTANGDMLGALLGRYREALDQYLQSLAQRLGPQADLPYSLLQPNGQVLHPEDIFRSLNRLRETYQAGARETAREMLRSLRQLTESLRNARVPSELGPALKDMREMQERLKDILDRQQKLLEQTFRQHQESRRSAHRDRMRSLADRQEAIRETLGESLERLGALRMKVPEALEQAEPAMRDAVDFLRKAAGRPAVEAQGMAVEALRQGAREALEGMMNRVLGGGSGPLLLPGGGLSGPGLDPLGRPGGNPDDGTALKIPDSAEMRGAREILDELRRRASDPDRPMPERDYLRRLLRQF